MKIRNIQPTLLAVAGLTILAFLPAPENGIAQPKRPPFVQNVSYKRVIQKDALVALEVAQAHATVATSGKALVFPDSVVQLIVRTGPASDMLSYRIQGLRNP